MNSRMNELLLDIGIGAVAGLVATKVTGVAQEPLYRLMPESVKRREERVRPAPSSQVAAQKMGEALGYDLKDRQREQAGAVVHYGLGAAWGPMYSLLRRHGGLRPLSAGIVTGAGLALIVDEGLAPALGFSAPNRAYPPLTHLRGLANHLVYGAAAALTTETFYRLTGTGPDRDGDTRVGSGRVSGSPSSA